MPEADPTTSQTGTTGGFALLPIHHVLLAIPRGGEDQCRALRPPFRQPPGVPPATFRLTLTYGTAGWLSLTATSDWVGGT